jgi:tRNA-modifying protein YgfZ
MSWQQFLDDLGAQRDEHGLVSHFQGRQAGHTPALIVGDHLAVLSVRGPDAATFLQGQLTCDLRQVQAGHWRLAMHLDLKGRGQHSYIVMPTNDGVDLLTHKARANDAFAALKKYAAFSKVSLALETGRIALMLHSPGHTDVLGDASIPAQVGEANHGPHSSLARLDPDTLILVTPDDGARALINHFTVAELGGANDWLALEIKAGIGHIQPGGEGLWLPQALNYDLIDGVNFKKGCYLGQEVVARMHFKGKMKQRLQHLMWQQGVTAPTGSVLRDADGHAVGELVVAIQEQGATRALVVLRQHHQGALHLNEATLAWQLQPLPYSLPE